MRRWLGVGFALGFAAGLVAMWAALMIWAVWWLLAGVALTAP